MCASFHNRLGLHKAVVIILLDSSGITVCCVVNEGLLSRHTCRWGTSEVGKTFQKKL